MLDFVNSYHETLFTITSFYQNKLEVFESSQVDGRIQITTIKSSRFSYSLLHSCCLLSKLPYLILKFKYGESPMAQEHKR